MEATIAFANGARIEIDGWQSDQKITAGLALAAVAHEQGLAGFEAPPLVTTLEGFRVRLREVTRQRLSLAIQDPQAAARVAMAAATADLVHPRAVIRLVSGGLSLSHFYEFSTEVELLHLGELLLMDPARAFGSKLCQCQLSTCGAFFLEKKPATGRPQRRYCDPDHMQLAHDQNAASRMRQRRAPAKAK